jgi:hypothetical protein
MNDPCLAKTKKQRQGKVDGNYDQTQTHESTKVSISVVHMNQNLSDALFKTKNPCKS